MNGTLFSSDSELAVLSILINNPDKVYDLNSLKSHMMSSSANQLVFATIVDIANRSLIPEINLIKDSLHNTNNLTSIGGADYLEYLKNLPYDCENFQEYIRLVIDSYKKRSMLSLSAKIPKLVETTDDADMVISQTKTMIDDLSSNSGGERTILLGTLFQNTWDQIVARVQNPGLRGHTTGFESLNVTTGGYTESSLIFIASRPGMGKTAMLCNSQIALALNDVPSLTFQYEMDRLSFNERIVGIDSGIPITDIRLGRLDSSGLDQIKESMKKIRNLPIYLDTNVVGGLEYILSTIRKYHRLKGVEVIFLDYIQLIAERSRDSTHELGRISRGLKLLTNELGISVVVLSQLHRGVEGRDDKRPLLSDLRQSGNLEEDADIVIMLYRDEYYNLNTDKKGKLEVIIRKHRNGPIGTTVLDFDAGTNRMKDG